MGTDGQGVYHRDLSGQVTHLLAPHELTNSFIRVFMEAADKSMWIGTDQGVTVIGPYRETLPIHRGRRLSQFSIRDIVQDRSGDVWVGTDKGLTHWRKNKFVQDLVTSALKEEMGWSILQDRKGTLWFGTRDHGLYRSRDGATDRYTVVQGPFQ